MNYIIHYRIIPNCINMQNNSAVQHILTHPFVAI